MSETRRLSDFLGPESGHVALCKTFSSPVTDDLDSANLIS